MVRGWVEGRGGEEAVVEEGAFKDSVDEEVEGVPDEEDAEALGGCRREDADRQEVGVREEEKDDGKGDNGCSVKLVH